MERLKAQVQVEIVAATKLENVYGVFEDSWNNNNNNNYNNSKCE